MKKICCVGLSVLFLGACGVGSGSFVSSLYDYNSSVTATCPNGDSETGRGGSDISQADADERARYSASGMCRQMALERYNDAISRARRSDSMAQKRHFYTLAAQEERYYPAFGSEARDWLEDYPPSADESMGTVGGNRNMGLVGAGALLGTALLTGSGGGVSSSTTAN